MSYFHFSRIAVVFYLVFFFSIIPFSAGQDLLATSTKENHDEENAPFKISVNVSEVRLDVVVVDNKGRPVTDLTAADFEVYQNKMPQEVTSSIYISNQVEDSARLGPAASLKDAPNLSPLSIPATTLKKEDVRRTIVFIVDSLSMKFEHLSYARASIKGFLEKQMLPGDLVAVIRTGYGNSALNFFSSDKSQISRRVDGIPYEPPMSNEETEKILYRIYDNQLSTLSFSIHALKDMPGRKIVFFMTSLPNIFNPLPDFTKSTEDVLRVPARESERKTNYYEIYAAPFDRLADDALRAGVVVYSLDVRGLEYYEPGDPRDLEKTDASNPLPEKTGGTYIQNSNFFRDGIGEAANNMIAGYYLVSYIPPASTFERRSKDIYHRVNIKVKRKGAVVHTRDGFYGRTEIETDSVAPPVNHLANAIFSPFLYTDLNVNIAAGYVKGPKSGNTGIYPDYLLRAWIHLDPKDIKIVATEGDSARIVLETICLTSGINGYVQDSREMKYTFDIQSENIPLIQEQGIRFSLLLPVKKPGAYTVHIAIRDADSGKVGSAYQFVEIPDLKKKGMNLSSIFMLTSTDDLNWMRSDVINELAKGEFSPILHESGIRSPALRTYVQGDSFNTLTMLYNADAKAIANSEIEIQSILYKDGKEFLRSEPKSVIPDKTEEPDSISLLQSLIAGPDMSPGDYVLQRLATDKKNSQKRDEEGGVFSENQGLFSKMIRSYLGGEKNYNKKGVASQTMSFTVAETVE